MSDDSTGDDPTPDADDRSTGDPPADRHDRETVSEAAAEDVESGGASPTTPRIAGPQKLNVLTIPYQIAQQGVSIAIAIFVFGGGSASALFGSGRSLLAIGAIVAIFLGIAAFVGYFVARYRRFEYELTADTFDIRSGVLSRRNREIPLRRIQNVDISQNVVQRALGIAEVGLETAGGGGTEAQLRYVGVDEAEALQSEISRLSRVAKTEDGETAATDEERFDTVFSITERELGVLALISVDLRIASFLFFGASIFAPSAASMAQPDNWWEYGFGLDSLVGAFLGPLAALGAIAALALVSGVLNAARYYGFTLDRGEDELRYERGLLQKYRGTIPLSKVQTLTLEENVLARALDYAALTIETAGYTPTSGESNGSQSAIPVAERDRVVTLARSLEPFDDSTLERPPKRARLRYGFRYAIGLAVIVALLYAGTAFTDFQLYWYVPLVAAPLVPVAAHYKWKHLGYALGEDHVVTRNGFWVRRQKVVPYHRVQTVFSSQTVFQRRRDLATVTVDTAGSQSITGQDAQAVDIDAETAERIREAVSDELYGALARRRRDGRTRSGAGETGGSSRAGPGSLGDGSGSPGD
ncbi:membrane-flanked domain protein [Halosimplex carlsbadense 2-9-1]|uniref:Membrane-flanked domain protein n=1 Tax=Halosimplex carlsbadense 2-9-1 TaxID=797114 RepID=M0CLL4_9EURY|nr:PH domain-containing protein [Halosimplex carlsbadense]ELZ24136.1 membrane-flanked domain protein [Halosimplex carlsbadense 2-9-1]